MAGLPHPLYSYGMKNLICFLLLLMLPVCFWGEEPLPYSEADTYRVNSDDGAATTTLCSAGLYSRLMRAFENRLLLQDKGITLIHVVRQNRQCFIYTDENRGLHFTFALEKADKSVLQSVIRPYMNNPDTQKEVYARYKDNYIIRIYSAENVLAPEKEEITDEEISIMASLVEQVMESLLEGYGASFKVD